MKEKLTLIIADDHPYEVSGIKGLLEFAKEIDVVDIADTAQQAVKKTMEKKPDVILLDLIWYKRKEDGLEAIRQIREGAPETRILVMTAYDETLEEARRAGADQVTSKDFLNSKQALVTRIRDAYEARQLPLAKQPNHIPLSGREMDVLKLMCEGRTDREIASELNLAESTVGTYVGSVFNKLGVNRRTEAVAYALNHRLLPPVDRA